MTNGNHEALDDRIGLLRRQIANLTDQAAAASGAGVEEALSDQISEKQERLDELLKQRGDAAAP